MRSVGVVWFCTTAIMCSQAQAMDCSDIKPAPPQSSESVVEGKLDGRIEGLFKKLLNAGGRADITSRKAATDILPQFPDADRLYVWERILFLQCETLNEDKTLGTRAKLAEFEHLLKLYNQPPPAAISDAGGNRMTNSGNNVNSVQGSGNTVSIGGGKP